MRCRRRDCRLLCRHSRILRLPIQHHRFKNDAHFASGIAVRVFIDRHARIRNISWSRCAARCAAGRHKLRIHFVQRGRGSRRRSLSRLHRLIDHLESVGGPGHGTAQKRHIPRHCRRVVCKNHPHHRNQSAHTQRGGAQHSARNRGNHVRGYQDPGCGAAHRHANSAGGSQ